jgi:hypothetical protein
MEKNMNIQTTGGAGTVGELHSNSSSRSELGKAAQDAASFVSDTARQVTEQVKLSASDAASSVTGQVKELLDGQVGSGAQMVGHLANSAKLAADDLQRNAPQLAGLVRGVAGRIEGLADDMRGQSVDSLIRSASAYTRQKPALVFGLAALAGFFVLRTLKAAPSHDLTNNYTAASRSEGAKQFHGV